jgi:hypothetical protein
MSNMTSPWIKASKSSSNTICVEMRTHQAAVEIRDSKAKGTGPSLRLDPGLFAALLHDAKSGTLDQLK